ncbi:MAG: transmembrane 220 family protein [Alphaproteobacteria bacterium]|nr:transmembrane 220 family protein [Alphaproteobacteria bacterium]
MARWVELFWTGCFVLSVLVQYNDPDPLRWSLMYGAAALICGWPGLPRRAELGVVLVAIAGIWAATLVPGVLADAELMDLFRTMKHENHAEEARELGGLVLVAGAVAWVAVRSFRSRSVA